MRDSNLCKTSQALGINALFRLANLTAYLNWFNFVDR